MTTMSFVGGPFGGTTVEVELPEAYHGAPADHDHVDTPPVLIAWPGNCTVFDALELNLVAVLREKPDWATSVREEVKPDTMTLELPAGMTLAEALKARQVRLIRESASRVLASVYLKIVRYRNGLDGAWMFVPYK